MARALPTEFDLIQLYQQFCADLTQAQSLEAGVDRCVTLLEQCLTPRACGVGWGAVQRLRARAPHSNTQTHQPQPEELAQLGRGEPVIRVDGERIAAAFAPLRAQGALMGWLYIEE